MEKTLYDYVQENLEKSCRDCGIDPVWWEKTIRPLLRAPMPERDITKKTD